jgi:hypothetical protein
MPGLAVVLFFRVSVLAQVKNADAAGTWKGTMETQMALVAKRQR